MPTQSPFSVQPAVFPRDLEAVRRLFREYADSLGIDLSFQGFEDELASLPGNYASPAGQVFLARDPIGRAFGCVGLRPTSHPGTCEMKRLYVQEAARGHYLGRRLAEAVLVFAKEQSYARIVLDTLSTMRAAQRLYLALGFKPTEPYYINPVPGTLYYARDL